MTFKPKSKRHPGVFFRPSKKTEPILEAVKAKGIRVGHFINEAIEEKGKP